MQKFLRLLQQVRSPKLSAEAFAEEVGGAETLQILRQLGLVVSTAAASIWPCGGTRERACPRRVVQAGPGSLLPFIAVCPTVPPRCSNIPLGEQDLALLKAPTDAVVSLLGQLFSIAAAPTPPIPSWRSGARYLGTSKTGGRHAYFEAEPLDPSFLSFLAELRVARCEVVVFVPSRWQLPAVVDRLHVDGDAPGVQVVFLDEVLELRGAQVVVAAEHLEKGLATEPGYCRLVRCGTSEASQVISESRLKSLITEGDFDLLLDMTAKAAEGYLAFLRTSEGVNRVAMTKSEMLLLCEIATSRGPILSRNLRWSDVRGPMNVFYRAREKLPGGDDLFPTMGTGQKHVMKLQFRPSASFRCAVCLPLDLQLP